MIYEYDSQINIWLGEGDVGIGIAMDIDGIAYGIGFTQLDKKYDIGEDVSSNKLDGTKSINILFKNEKGIKSLMEGLERVVAKLVEQQITDSQNEKLVR